MVTRERNIKKRQTHTFRKVSGKDSLFTLQTFTECLVLPSAIEQMAQGSWFIRTPTNWRIPCSPQMTTPCLLHAPICHYWSPDILSESPALRSRSLSIFLSVNRSWGIIMPNWHKQLRLPSEFGLKPNYISLACATEHEQYNLSYFLLLLFRIFKKKIGSSETNQACSLRIILSTIYKPS